MNMFKTVKRLKRLLLVLSIAFTFLVLTPTTAFAQSSKVTALCRQANPDAGAGLVAFFSPENANPITAIDGRKDGPGAGEAVFLTDATGDVSADGRFIRVWFKSLDPNFKLGWIATEDEPLKKGSNSWRAQNCIQ